MGLNRLFLLMDFLATTNSKSVKFLLITGQLQQSLIKWNCDFPLKSANKYRAFINS